MQKKDSEAKHVSEVLFTFRRLRSLVEEKRRSPWLIFEMPTIGGHGFGNLEVV